MKKAAIIILIAAAVFSVILLALSGAESKPYKKQLFQVSLLRSSIPEYYRRSYYYHFIPADEEIAAFRAAWNSSGHTSVDPFYTKLDNDAYFSLSGGGMSESFSYNSETGHLMRRIFGTRTEFKFENYRPILKRTNRTDESYTIVSGENKDKLDAIVAKYKKGLPFLSSIILERTGFDPDLSESGSGIDLSQTLYIPDSKGVVPQIPEAVINYLKKHHARAAVDSVRTFENKEIEYKNESVYVMNIRVPWDETHDRIYVLEYDALSGALYSSEFEDVDPENGAKYSQDYDEIFICQKIRKEAESVFPMEEYHSYFGCVVLDYLPDDPSIKHTPAGMTYAEYEKNCSDEDFEIRMNMCQKSEGVEVDLEAVKAFMIEWLIDSVHVESSDGEYFLLRRIGTTVFEDGSGQFIYD